MKRRRLIVPSGDAPPLVARSFARGPADPPAPNVAPRMPSLPSSLVYSPPAAEVARILDTQAAGAGADAAEAGEPYEAYTQTVGVPRLVESSVYTTARRWRAIDVYASFGEGRQPGAVLTVRVYAVMKGARVLVASGRIGPESTVDPITLLVETKSRWVAGARASASFYEVTLYGGPAASITLTDQVQVSIVATDQAVELPNGLGGDAFSPTMVAGGALDLNVIGDDAWPDAELLWATYAVDEALGAASRYLQVFDQAAAPVLGDVPILSWEIHSGHGGVAGVIPWPAAPCYRFRKAGWLRASSTFSTLTAAADVALNAWVR